MLSSSSWRRLLRDTDVYDSTDLATLATQARAGRRARQCDAEAPTTARLGLLIELDRDG